VRIVLQQSMPRDPCDEQCIDMDRQHWLACCGVAIASQSNP
jgi:hypothetical protein